MRGQAKGPELNEAIETERKNLRAKAETVMKMKIDQPDPHGSGGTTGMFVYFFS